MSVFARLSAVVAMLCGIALARADEAKEVTITGEGLCAKCALKESKTCQDIIEVVRDGKAVRYYLARNQVAKDYHKSSGLCSAPVKTTATGTVKEENGRKILTATKIEEAK